MIKFKLQEDSIPISLIMSLSPILLQILHSEPRTVFILGRTSKLFRTKIVQILRMAFKDSKDTKSTNQIPAHNFFLGYLQNLSLLSHPTEDNIYTGQFYWRVDIQAGKSYWPDIYTLPVRRNLRPACGGVIIEILGKKLQTHPVLKEYGIPPEFIIKTIQDSRYGTIRREMLGFAYATELRKCDLTIPIIREMILKNNLENLLTQYPLLKPDGNL